jgi:hypothetical protein
VPFYTPKWGSAGALADPTKPANTFGQGNPPNMQNQHYNYKM